MFSGGSKGKNKRVKPMWDPYTIFDAFRGSKENIEKKRVKPCETSIPFLMYCKKA